MQKIKTATGYVWLSNDGNWFQFQLSHAAPMCPVIPPDKKDFASSGKSKYRDAIRAIAEWKKKHNWKVTPC